MIALGRLCYNPETGVFVFAAGSRIGETAGYIKTDGYRLIWVDGKYRYAHRLAWLACHGTEPSGEIDHINGLRDDNRIANLRVVTRSQNMMNADIGIGCHWHSRQRRWQALIRAEGKRLFLGTFATKEEAKAAYELARQKLHGEFSFVEKPAPAVQEALL